MPVCARHDRVRRHVNPLAHDRSSCRNEKRRFEMKSHCRLVLILAIAYSLPALLSNTAQTNVKSADEARSAQVNERKERRSLAERGLDGNARFDLHFNHLASPALIEAGWTKSLAISPQPSMIFTVN